MTLPQFLLAGRGFLGETLAQARAAGVTTALSFVTVVATVFCLGVGIHGETQQLPTQPWENPEYLPQKEADRIGLGPAGVRNEGVDVPTGAMSLLFGAVEVPLSRTGAHAVRLVQTMLAGGLADTAGVLLALIWTAGFLPGFLDPAAASVLFAKPVSRGMMLFGKFVGVLAAVALQALAFVFATWLALGIKTGLWDIRYFVAVPVLLVHFGTFFSLSALLAVFTRSTVAAALGVLVGWFGCATINLLRHDTLLSAGAVPGWLESAYWILFKPLDGHLLLAQSMAVEDSFRTVVDLRRLNELGFSAELAVLSGIPLAAGLLFVAARRLARLDY
ncbi:MAG: ABC transporter permease [Gemmataceae bacterium]|nr:ABC transporter permease [Gemmataceae bacterium]